MTRRPRLTQQQLTRLVTSVERLSQVYDDNYQIIVSAAALFHIIERQLHSIASELTTLRQQQIPRTLSPPPGALMARTLTPMKKRPTRQRKGNTSTTGRKR